MSDPSIRTADPLHPTDKVPDLDAAGDHVSTSTVAFRPAVPLGSDATARDLPAVPGFRVLREIARGGMGRVLAAHDLTLDREVALKVLLPGAPADRFVRESKITARLPHPGIPPVHALGALADGSPFLAMKLIAGQTLAEKLKTANRPLLLAAFEQVCQAVGFAHSRGVIHRDLKPANVMVGAFGEVQVMDWGLAKERHIADPSVATLAAELASPRPEETQAGLVMGTPAYMAPEQARGEAADARADVFALGGILCAILTGKPPFVGLSTPEVAQRAGAADLAEPFARLFGCGADAELVALCRRCLSPDPAERPADGQVVAAAVAGYRAGVEQRLRAAERDRTAAEVKAAEQKKRRRVQLALAGAVVLLLLGVGVFGWWQNRLAGDRLVEQTRNGQQIEALLDRCEAAIQQDDAASAQFAAGEAEKRAVYFGADHLKERLARCRSASEVLVDLDRIDALRYGTEEGRYQGEARAVQEWPGTLARIGVVIGQTPPAQAAEAVNGSLARDRLLGALDLWLVFAAQADRADVAAILAVADADPFRDAIRAGVQRSDWKAVGVLAAQDEALGQPARFAAALGSIAAVPAARRLAVLEAAARARPRDYGVLMTAGAQYRLHDPGTAAERIGFYRCAVIVHPTSVIPHFLLAGALYDRGDLDGAIAEGREAINLDPKYAVAHFNQGNALYAKGDLDGAIAEYRVAIQLDPKFAYAHNGLGIALRAKGDLDGAVAAFRKAAELDPKLAQSTTGGRNAPSEQARGRAARGDWSAAAASYAEIFAAQPPEDGRRWFEYAAVLLLSGDQPGYRKMCADMVERSGQPGMRPYLVARACTLAPDSVTDPKQPGQRADNELKGSQAFWSLTEQGALSYRAGRYDEAATLLEQSLKADNKPGRAVLNWLWLSLVEQRRGKPAEARAWLEEATKWFAQYPEGVPVPPDDAKGLHLHNWLEAQVLRREAESLLGPKE